MVSRRGAAVAAVGLGVLALGSCGGGADEGSRAEPTPQMPRTTPKPARDAPQKPATGVPPKPGTVLVQFDGDGRLNVVTSGKGFLLVQEVNADPDPSTITAYDASGAQLAKLRAPSFDGACGAKDVVVDGRRLILTEKTLIKPAEGVKPAKSTLELDAWDAKTGARQWTTTIVPTSVGYRGCASPEDGQLEGFAITRNGRWAFYSNTHDFMENEIVDLRTGTVRAYPEAVGIIGDYTIEPSGATDFDTGGIVLTDPASGEELGRIEDVDISYKEFDPAPPGMAQTTDSNGWTTADGRRLVTAAGEQGAERLTVFSLPDGKPLWKVPADYSVVADADGTLVAYRDAIDEVEKGRTFVLDDTTGEPLWDLSPALNQVCGLTKSQLLAAANAQLTTIEPRTGKQISFDADSGSDCPDLRPGGIGVASEDNLTPGVKHDITVVQVLAP